MRKITFVLILSLFTSSLFAQGDYGSASPNNKKDFGKNIIAFNPVHLIAADFVGIGFSYERLVNQNLGIKVPVMIAINNNYFNIGIEAKLYPTKNTGPVKYAIAPTLMAGIGETKSEQYVLDTWGNYVLKTITEPASQFGFLLNQTLNITISKQFYIGLDGGFGINYYDEKVKNSSNTNLSFAAQLQIGMGYRF